MTYPHPYRAPSGDLDGPRHLRRDDPVAGGHGGRRAAGRPLADDYYRLSHHSITGARLVDGHVGDLGLAAALLGELLGEGAVVLQHGLVLARPGPLSSHSALTMGILERVHGEREPLPLVDWLKFLAGGAHRDVAERLLVGRHVTAFETGLLRKRTVYEPVDTNDWYWVGLDIANRLGEDRPMTIHQLLLAGLAAATNVLAAVMGERAGAERLGSRLAALPAAAQHLLHATRETVTDLAGL